MNIKKLSRKEKEQLYIAKMTELQLHWKNPIDSDWDFINDWSDEELGKGLEDTIGQLRFEKTFGAISGVVKFVVIGFIILGIFGLLLFGIKPIF